jgi:hypothetical protein
MWNERLWIRRMVGRFRKRGRGAGRGGKLRTEQNIYFPASHMYTVIQHNIRLYHEGKDKLTLEKKGEGERKLEEKWEKEEECEDKQELGEELEEERELEEEGE